MTDKKDQDKKENSKELKALKLEDVLRPEYDKPLSKKEQERLEKELEKLGKQFGNLHNQSNFLNKIGISQNSIDKSLANLEKEKEKADATIKKTMEHYSKTNEQLISWIDKQETTLINFNQQYELLKGNFDAMVRPLYSNLADRFVTDYSKFYDSFGINIEVIESLLNQTNPLLNIQNTLESQLIKYDVSHLATNALVDFESLLGSTFVNQGAELTRALEGLSLEKYLTDVLGLYELKHNIEFEVDEKQPSDSSKLKTIDLEDASSYKTILNILAQKHGINKQAEELTELDKEFIFSQEEKYTNLKNNKKKRGAYLHYIFIGRAIVSFLDRQRLNNNLKQFKKPTPTNIFNEIKYHYSEFDHDNIIDEPHYITDNSFEWITRKGNGKTCTISSTLLTRVFDKFNPNRNIYTALNQKDLNNLKNNLE